MNAKDDTSHPAPVGNDQLPAAPRPNRAERRRMAAVGRGKGGPGWRSKKQRLGEEKARKRKAQ